MNMSIQNGTSRRKLFSILYKEVVEEMIKQSEIQNENVKTLLDLIKDNPDLLILPMVDGEVVAGDDYSNWAGSFGNSEVDYIWNNGEKIHFRSTDFEELVEKEITRLEYVGKRWNRTVEEQAEKNINDLEWQKVIVVQIGLP